MVGGRARGMRVRRAARAGGGVPRAAGGRIVRDDVAVRDDLAVRRAGASLLPAHDIVVFDEAHMVEGVAAAHLGIGVSAGGVERVLSRLWNERTQRGQTRWNSALRRSTSSILPVCL